MKTAIKNVIEMPAPAVAKRRKGRFKLTDATVADLVLQGADREFGPEERHPAIYYDTEVRGFHVLCHRTSKSYYVQHDIAGKYVVVQIGRTNMITAQKARKQAMAHIMGMKNGINPNDDRKARNLDALAKAETEAFTLADAVRLHLYERKKERSEKTISEYQHIFDTHLVNLIDKPLTWLGANQIAIENLHDTITREGWDSEARKGRGRKKRRPAPYAANAMVRVFRAVYNHARVKKPHLNLPEFRPVEMNPEAAKDSALTLEELPIWHKAVIQLGEPKPKSLTYPRERPGNPIRRDFHLFVLFTGNRSTATSEILWDNVDLTGAKNGTPSVYVPSPKGGKAKAFYIPLSDYLVDLLTARRACVATNAAFPDSPWVFPAVESKTGHIEEPTEKRDDFLKRFSPHALRHSYITFAQFAGVNVTDIAFLANQRPKSITVQYMKALLGPLRDRQQQVTNYIREHLAKS